MTFYKKAAIPAMVSMALAVGSTAWAQDDLLVDHQIVKSPMQVQSSQTHSYQAQAHPLTQSIIIKFKTPSKNTKSALNKVASMSQKMGVDFEFKRHMSGEAEVWRVANLEKSSFSNLQSLVEQLNSEAAVEYAEVDAWVIPYRTPNDSRYNEQWHYKNTTGGMRLPGAWDENTGSTAVTVAVLDTGYRPHADLVGNVVGEYDMISSSSVGNDGNGRDSNAQDPGDWVTANQCGQNPAQDSSWHGTHVAGTVAAVSDNGSGVAGVAWNVNLVPVRVLGTCGGSLSDIADGIRWAAGLSVSGTPSNNNPADVINMSLGSASPTACSSTYQNAINAAYNAGSTIVVAAGNDNSSSGYPPANCSNVISVAAGANDGARAFYSNYGSSIDITAPGGDGCNPVNNSEPTSLSDCEGGVWEDSRMILSTHNSGTQGPSSDNYGWLQGTSMAAPHVAGLAALIKSVDGSLTPAEVEQIIKDSADSFANVPDHQCSTSICGAGYANATAALQLADGGSNPPPPPGDTELTKGVAETGLSAGQNGQLNFTLEVPSGATNLSFDMSGGSGDADLYVNYGSAATTSNYDCRPYESGNNENCDFASPQAGTYHVMINGYSAFSNVSLVADYDESTPPPPPSGGELTNGVAETGLSGAASSQSYFTLDVPSGASDLSFVMSGGTGDADLYVQYGSDPTTSSYDCRPYQSGNNETCDISSVQAGTYHVMIRGYSAYSNVSLIGSYTEGSSGGQTFFQNGTNVSIPDNSPGGVTSTINVNRSGTAGTVEIKFDIVHTWRGDLTVNLIASNGATVNLHERTNTGDSADNLSKTVSVNASSVSASGNWQLEVIDGASADTGYIDSWSIEFQ